MGNIHSGPDGSHEPAKPFLPQVGQPPSLDTSISQSSDAAKLADRNAENTPSRPTRNFELHVAVDRQGALYLVNVPAGGNGRSVEQKLFELVSGQHETTPQTVTFRQDQRVVLSFVNEREKFPASLAALEGTPISQVVLKLEQRRVTVLSAKGLSGEQLLPTSTVTQTATAAPNKQLTMDQKKWLSRQERILELQFDPALIVSESELLSTKRTGTYPASAVKHLKDIEDSFKVLFNLELRKDAPKSAKSGRPSWTAEFLKITHDIKNNLNTPSPYFDTLLTVLDPKNPKHRSMAHCGQLKAFLSDCTDLGLMPNLTEAGRAKIVIKPVIERLIPLAAH